LLIISFATSCTVVCGVAVTIWLVITSIALIRPSVLR
jgi:hypothetical protein